MGRGKDGEGEVELKKYLGDGVYVTYDGFAWILTTESGNTIYLEPFVYHAFTEYVKRTISQEESNGL